MPLLSLGSRGTLVARWNRLLRENGFASIGGDVFELASKDGTRAFQRFINQRLSAQVLRPDGIAGNLTLGAGIGFNQQDDFTAEQCAALAGDTYPPLLAGLPGDLPRQQKEALFGAIEFQRQPLQDNPEHILITNDWKARHLSSVVVPQLAGIVGAPSSGKVAFNVAVTAQLAALWRCWDTAGLLPNVRSFAGTFAPRLIRGSMTQLSNHAYATAFDINADANALGALPALRGEQGSLLDLVPLANQLGFYWGGHYRGRLDGMHFEATRVLTPAQIQAVVAQAEA